MNGKTPVTHELASARDLAEYIVNRLRPYCDRIEIAGSIRRKRPEVHDIDLVLIPFEGELIYEVTQMMGAPKLAGNKLIRLTIPSTGIFKTSPPGITVDIYIATRETWATLLLIRTGSKAHNIKLCKRARSMGMKLHADGSGLTRGWSGDGERIAGDTEESIFNALGMDYIPPEEREY